MLDLHLIRSVLFDMDGVLYRGDDALPGVEQLWGFFEDQGIGYACLTNNSTLTQDQFVAKLRRMGLHIVPERIITSGVATSAWLRERAPSGTEVYAVGMDGLHEALFGDGYFVEQPRNPQYVVVGSDWEVTYAKLRTACLAIRAGATFIGTNPDRTFPAEDGLIPGCGALLAALEAATDVKPIVIGKPELAVFTIALHLLRSEAATTLMVGDRLDTDIDGAHDARLPTALVLTGVSSAAELAGRVPKPDAVFADLPALLHAWQDAPKG